MKAAKKPSVFVSAKKRTAPPAIGDEEVECSQRTLSREFIAPSESNPKKKYKVRYTKVSSGAYEWGCDCPAFIYKKIGVFDCKHIRVFTREVCRWKSTAGPESQVKAGVCPRCGGKTQVVQKEIES